MTKDRQDAIVAAFNEVRSEIAQGKIEHYDQAANMATIQWDDGLAANAALNVHQCEMKHDPCHTGISNIISNYFKHTLSSISFTKIYRQISVFWAKSCHGNDNCGTRYESRNFCRYG